MNRKLIVGGSVGAVVLLVLAMFPAVVGAQTVNDNNFMMKNVHLNELSIFKTLSPGRLLDFWDLWTLVAGLFFSLIVQILVLIFG